MTRCHIPRGTTNASPSVSGTTLCPSSSASTTSTSASTRINSSSPSGCNLAAVRRALGHTSLASEATGDAGCAPKHTHERRIELRVPTHRSASRHSRSGRVELEVLKAPGRRSQTRFVRDALQVMADRSSFVAAVRRRPRDGLKRAVYGGPGRAAAWRAASSMRASWARLASSRWRPQVGPMRCSMSPSSWRTSPGVAARSTPR